MSDGIVDDEVVRRWNYAERRRIALEECQRLVMEAAEAIRSTGLSFEEASRAADHFADAMRRHGPNIELITRAENIRRGRRG